MVLVITFEGLILGTIQEHHLDYENEGNSGNIYLTLRTSQLARQASNYRIEEKEEENTSSRVPNCALPIATLIGKSISRKRRI